MLLKVVDLHVEVAGVEVLKGVSLDVREGEIHALMGPNGSGKSTLAYTILGREGYLVKSGDILFEGRSVLGLSTDERARLGIFLALQEPPQIPGLRLSPFLNAIINKRLCRKELNKLPPPQVLAEVGKALQAVGLSRPHLSRELNMGFSGGEKKRSELLQAILLKPKLLILDEPDSGLDADGVKAVARIINSFKQEGKGVLLITHYARLLKHVPPDEVTVLYRGKVAVRGGPEIAERIDSEGYSFLNGSVGKDEH
ncbi:MAG: Fe-S cluster assembly ATPase SufC [Desulfurococcales archaeon]|nr:Fe-S cluster assembly ATPase SufC [Desulfurococcales archaeon]